MNRAGAERGRVGRGAPQGAQAAGSPPPRCRGRDGALGVAPPSAVERFQRREEQRALRV